MSGVVILIAILGISIAIFGDDMAHGLRVLFRDECTHRISWDMPCLSCEDEGRFRK